MSGVQVRCLLCGEPYLASNGRAGFAWMREHLALMHPRPEQGPR